MEVRRFVLCTLLCLLGCCGEKEALKTDSLVLTDEACESSLSLSTPEEAMEALAVKLDTGDWDEIEKVCTEQGVRSLEDLCYNFRTAISEGYTDERVLKEKAAYVRQHPPISRHWFSPDVMRFELGWPSLLFARTEEGWKLHYWCEEPGVTPWEFYVEEHRKEK